MYPQDLYPPKIRQSMEESFLRSTAEEYLETICRLSAVYGFVRINFLAAQYTVTPDAARKIILYLQKGGWVLLEKYGTIRPTTAGQNYAAYLQERHESVHRFFCAINRSQNEKAQADMIEHFLDKRTVKNIQLVTCLLDTKNTSVCQ